METNIILSKECSQASLYQYFGTIYQLSHNGNEFPINLDQVFHLVYITKGKAVEALKKNFIEGIDYKILLPQLGKQTRGGQNRVDYYLSVPCLEFFIARKVRAVFEVYRQVFHRVADEAVSGNQSQIQLLMEVLDGKKREIEVLTQANIALQKKVDQLEEELSARMKQKKLISTTKIAQLFGYRSGGELLSILEDKDVIFRAGESWMLMPEYEGKGYAEYLRWSHNGRSIDYIGWTKKGVSMLVVKLNIW